MRENDTALIRLLDLPVALVLLTRLPLPALPDAGFAREARAVWAFGLAGAVVGGIGAAVASIALGLGLAPVLAAGLCLGAQMIATGAMHEDGLADTVDGFWGGWTAERRLEIMKDSHIGTYGVLALVLSVGLRWLALSVVLNGSVLAVIAVAMLSRAVLPTLMAALPRARPGGLSDRVGRPPMAAAGLAAALGVFGVVACLGAQAAPVLLVTLLAAGGMAALARAKIGGQTGDVLGATQQMIEIACLLVLSSTL
ncbi:adenosylcobinamide-GDP ribazoletransferase [Aestuariivita sp.]|jgi:adenosylcobinamide-GDP ribazoletransferase|uniref:adenosylcobinamide-GDP ribazoletransferase n=1 Tax=Aestuariivita sp. TaxID=1872407 RepID=UPI0021734D6D|nr:adenosylcobinamide-GDP ribazoletransferase [Aestuariivita sp.]MCE8009792.1 adenosylcobinamide-GDP ribazoletransferase [Aestuariivita sp.]